MAPHQDTTPHTFLEGITDAVVVVDYEGIIIVVNHQAEEMFGYLSAELIGQHIEILVPDRAKAAHPHHRAIYYLNPSRRPMGAGLQLSARKKNGIEFPVDISLSPLEMDGQQVVLSTVRDMAAHPMYEPIYVTQLTENVASLTASVKTLSSLFEQDRERSQRRRRNDAKLFFLISATILASVVAQWVNVVNYRDIRDRAVKAERAACLSVNQTNLTLRGLFGNFRHITPTPIPPDATRAQIAAIRAADSARQEQTDQFFVLLDQRTAPRDCA